MNQPRSARGGCERVAPRHDEAVWRVARGPSDDRVGRERVDEITGPNLQAVYPQGERRGRVVEARPGGRDGEPMAIQPALDEPARVREGDAEIIQRGGSSTPEPHVGVGRQRIGGGHECRWFWKRQLLALARDGAEDRVHEAGGAAFAGASSQLDRVVHRRRGRHPIQVQQLVDAEAKNVQDFRVEPSGGAPCEVRDQVVEGALPSQGAGGDSRRRAHGHARRGGTRGCARAPAAGPRVARSRLAERDTPPSELERSLSG